MRLKIYPFLTKKCQMFEFGNQKMNNIETKEVTRIAEYSIRAAFFFNSTVSYTYITIIA